MLHIKSFSSIGKKWLPSIFSKRKLALLESKSLTSGESVDASEAYGTYVCLPNFFMKFVLAAYETAKVFASHSGAQLRLILFSSSITPPFIYAFKDSSGQFVKAPLP